MSTSSPGRILRLEGRLMSMGRPNSAPASLIGLSNAKGTFSNWAPTSTIWANPTSRRKPRVRICTSMPTLGSSRMGECK